MSTEIEPAPEPAVLTPATPRELRGLMKDWRRGRATRNLGQALSDAYVAVIAALMIGAMTVNVILKAQRVVAACNSASCLSARALLPWAAVLGGTAVALAVSRLFGPVLASAAEGFWLLDAPDLAIPTAAVASGRRPGDRPGRRRVDRRRHLRPDRLGPDRDVGVGRRDRCVRGGRGGLRGRPARSMNVTG